MAIRCENIENKKLLEWLTQKEREFFAGASSDASKIGEPIITFEPKGDTIKAELVSDVIYNPKGLNEEEIFNFFKTFCEEFPSASISGSYTINDKYSSFIVRLEHKPGDKRLEKEYMTSCNHCGKEISKDEAFISDPDLYNGFCCFEHAFEEYLVEGDECFFEEEAEEIFWEAFYENWESVITADNAETVLENIPEEQEDAINLVEEFIEENC